MTYLDGIARFLGTNVPALTWGETAGGNVFVDWAPATPMEAVFLISIPGQIEPDSKLPYDMAEFQVVVRGGEDQTWAPETMQAIYSWLQGLRSVTLPDGTYVVSVLAEQSSPMRLADDENGRPRWSIDFSAEIVNETQERKLNT